MADKKVRVFVGNGMELDVPRFDRGEVRRMLEGIEIDGIIFPDGRKWVKRKR